MRARLGQRIVMSPATASRLLAELGAAMQHPQFLLTTPAAEPTSCARPGHTPPPSRAPTPPEAANLLCRLVHDLHIEYAIERSFKIRQGAILPNRFLLGVTQRAIPHGTHATLVAICQRLGMPPNLLPTFEENRARANVVHFGFEENADASLYKVYLEFGDQFVREIERCPTRPNPFLLYLGFKWDPRDARRQALARYTCYPSLTQQDIVSRLSALSDAGARVAPIRVAGDILRMAFTRAGLDDMLYLEVREDGNPRKSFDINLYQAGLRIADVHALLGQACQELSVPARGLAEICGPLATQALGHLSGGIDREGQGFVTVHYGVAGHHP